MATFAAFLAAERARRAADHRGHAPRAPRPTRRDRPRRPAGAVGGSLSLSLVDPAALLGLKAITDTGALPDPDVLAAHRRLIVSPALIGARPTPGRPARSAAGTAPWPAGSADAWRTTC